MSMEVTDLARIGLKKKTAEKKLARRICEAIPRVAVEPRGGLSRNASEGNEIPDVGGGGSKRRAGKIVGVTGECGMELIPEKKLYYLSSDSY